MELGASESTLCLQRPFYLMYTQWSEAHPLPRQPSVRHEPRVQEGHRQNMAAPSFCSLWNPLLPSLPTRACHGRGRLTESGKEVALHMAAHVVLLIQRFIQLSFFSLSSRFFRRDPSGSNAASARTTDWFVSCLFRCRRCCCW